MIFEMGSLSSAERYKLLTSCIAPRPIAWVTSLSDAGVANAAPFSFFNVMGDSPPLIAIGLSTRADGARKDTAANILARGEFVVNLVGEADAACMNLTSMDAPSHVSELAAAGIAAAPSLSVAPPRIESAPASFECRLLHKFESESGQLVALGEVIVAHVRDEFILDRDRLYLDAPAMRLISRLAGPGNYARLTDRFAMDRPSYAAFLNGEIDR